jgi:hypothetical protein
LAGFEQFTRMQAFFSAQRAAAMEEVRRELGVEKPQREEEETLSGVIVKILPQIAPIFAGMFAPRQDIPAAAQVQAMPQGYDPVSGKQVPAVDPAVLAGIPHEVQSMLEHAVALLKPYAPLLANLEATGKPAQEIAQALCGYIGESAVEPLLTLADVVQERGFGVLQVLGPEFCKPRWAEIMAALRLLVMQKFNIEEDKGEAQP